MNQPTEAEVPAPICKVCQRPMREHTRNAHTVQFVCACAGVIRYVNEHIGVFSRQK